MLVDTGMGADDVAHPYRSLGVPFTAAFRPQADPGETAVRRVRALGLDPADVRHIACTHLDLDHAGGLPDFPDAEVHVFAAEKDAAVDPSLRDRARYPSCHIDHGPKWATHDVDGDTWHGFESVRVLPGDGPEILLIPLVGHSRGHTGGRRPRRRRLAAALRRRLLPSRPDGDPARTARPGCALFQTAMAADGSARTNNEERLNELARDHGDEVRLFCAHDPVELERATAERERATAA